MPSRLSRGAAIRTSSEQSVIRSCARSARPCSTSSSPGNPGSRSSLLMALHLGQKIVQLFLELLRVHGGITQQLRFNLGETIFQVLQAHVSAAHEAGHVL